MKTGSTWRNHCAPIIAKVIAEWDGKDEKEVRKNLYNAYPYGERKMYPYKIWLDEIKAQMFKRMKKDVSVENLPMFTELQPCGHPISSNVYGGLTAFCGACADEARYYGQAGAV